MDICTRLLANYNCNILSKQDKTKEFYNISRILRNLRYRKSYIKPVLDINYVLINLIVNHYEKKKPVFKEISGPVNLYHVYDTKYGKDIYLFGEVHGRGDNCGNVHNNSIVNYLKQLIKNTNVFLDIFFEFYMLEKDSSYDASINEDSFIRDLFQNFKDCIEQQNCNLTRIHYFDIRTNARNEPTNLITLVYQKLNQKEEMLSEHMVAMLRYFDDPNKLLKYILDLWSKSKIYKKELNKTQNKNIASFLKKHIKDEIFLDFETTRKSSITIIETNKSIASFLTNKSNSSYRDAVSIIFNKLIRINSLFIDTYLLCRLYKKFENSNNQPDEPKNVIIYAGAAHIQTYMEFFKYNSCLEIESSVSLSDLSNNNSKKNRCLDMSSIKQPIFNIGSS